MKFIARQVRNVFAHHAALFATALVVAVVAVFASTSVSSGKGDQLTASTAAVVRAARTSPRTVSRTPAAVCEVSDGVRLCSLTGGVLEDRGLSFPTAYSSDGSKANIAAARVDARALIGRFTVPAGTTVLNHVPAGSHGCLARQGDWRGSGYANRWWVTSVAPQTVMHDLDFRSPRGSVPNEFGGFGGTADDLSCLSITLQWPSIVNRVAFRQVVVIATRLNDGRTGVLLTGESGGVILRSTSERIPDGVTSVTVTTTQPKSNRVNLQNSNVPRKTESLTISSLAAIQKIVALADTLPSLAGSAVSTGTAQLASATRTVTIDFNGAAGQQLALLQYTGYGAWGSSDGGGGQAIQLKIGGRWRSPLLDVYFVAKLRQLVPARLF